MSKYVEFTYCELPETPRDFDEKKFKAGDPEQIKLYKDSKVPRRKKTLTYEQIDEDDSLNYARVVPDGCMFIDFDNSKEAEEMYEIILHSGLRCLILETIKGYHFLFRVPDFYKKEMTGATNWFGYKFDTKGPGAVQIVRVCGMDRDERCSWEISELVRPKAIDIETLDVLPYWLWGKLKDTDLHKKGKPGESEYTLKDTPFTQLMEMREGGRHDHIVSRCSFFALSNGFYIDEFKDIINAIHDRYLAKHGTPMSEADLFGDLDKRWAEYEATMTSSGYEYVEKDRHWKKVKSKKEEKIDERRAAEYVFKQLDCYVTNKNSDGTFSKILHRYKDGDYNYRYDLPERRKILREFSDQNFKEQFFKEVEAQLMLLCIDNKKYIKRSNAYVIVNNKVLSCISPEAFDFSWLADKSPTDVVLPWNWYPEEWVEEHKEDLGGIIIKFIKELARDYTGVTHPEVERWLWVIAGAAMIPQNELQKIIVLSGGGSNGKSIYTSLIRFCLGEGMFNLAKIFDNSPQDGFWGAHLDEGILCVVDDMPEHYARDTFSYLKGAITGSDTVEINEKFKPKKTISILPQIIACTNHDFELYDKSEGMRRRVKVLPTEYEIPVDKRDGLKQFELVLNTMDKDEIAKYRLEQGGGSDDEGEIIIKMRPRERGVLESMKNGSLAWFANKARYEYMKALSIGFALDDSKGMTEKFEDTFSGGFDAELEEFLEWYATEKKVSIWTKELYSEYQEWHNEMATGEMLMKEKAFSMRLGKAIDKLTKKGLKLSMRKVLNDKRMSLNKLFIGEDAEADVEGGK